MKTDRLIDVLAMHAEAVPPGMLSRRVALVAGVGVFGAAVLMVALLGVRHDLATAVGLPMFWVKLAFAATVALGAGWLTVRLGQPGQPPSAIVRAARAMLAPVIALWLLAAVTLLLAPPTARVPMVLGSTWTKCPWLIALLSVPAFIASLWLLRGLAPTRPRAAGAAAGVFAGALSTLVYALHCPEMAAPFIALWYVVGIALPAAVGALLGPRLLRW